MNPCPLKTCCNVWGQCGTTDDFCTISSLGPPGTSEPGKNGCISNCGITTTNNGIAPKEFISIGYFEGWNKERPCLTMDVTQVGSSFTHIHFAFADVMENFQVSVSKVQEQFNKFVKMTGKKRILAFGVGLLQQTLAHTTYSVKVSNQGIVKSLPKTLQILSRATILMG